LKIVACYKCVPNTDNIAAAPDRTFSLDGAEWEIGQYDLRAIEEAARLAAETGASAVALSAGGDVISNSKLKKSVLSRGMSELVGIQSPALNGADSYVTASALRDAISGMEDVSLVICGEGSSDAYNQQVGNILGGMLGWTTINCISKIEIEGDMIKAERTADDGIELLRFNMPAVISVTSDINVPRIPSMKDILGAGKKPSSVQEPESICESASEVISVLAPESRSRACNIFETADEAAISEFAKVLREAL
jgi:electron transfer flavoprotein beta subunit